MKHASTGLTKSLTNKRALIGTSGCLQSYLHRSRACCTASATAVVQTPQVTQEPFEQQQAPQQQATAQLRRSHQQQQPLHLSIQHTAEQQGQHSQLQQHPEWPGLHKWRFRGIVPHRQWGTNNKPTDSLPEPAAATAEAITLPCSLVGVALQVLNTADPDLKAALTHRGWKAYCAGDIPLHEQQQQGHDAAVEVANSSSRCRDQQQQPQQPPDRPARPDNPKLVIPKHVPSPKDSPLPLAAHMLHNLAHIELNAIDLAWDTVARFSHLQLPPLFYEDFARVADDESRHFAWCVQRLAELGHKYGDMPAHDLLWQGAQSSAGDLGARLAIVPMSQEARGLDAGKRLAERLVGAGDGRSAAVVAAIAEEERAHVAVGVIWFTRLCVALCVDPPAAFRSWLAALGPELLKGPFNHQERQTVGLQRDWYDVSSWPQEQQQRVMKPALAAAARGKGLPISNTDQQQQQQSQQQLSQDAVQDNSSNAGSNGSVSVISAVSVPAVPQSGRDLEKLRQRLWQMLEVERVACSS